MINKINKNELKFQLFNPSEFTKRRELFLDSFPDTYNSLLPKQEYYFWKFHSMDSSNAYEFSLVYEKNLVSYYAALPYKYNYSNKKYNVGMVCDVMTSSHYRRNGLFSDISEKSLSELKKLKVDFTTGNPVQRYITRAHLKSGWQNLFSMPLYIRFIKSNSILKNFHLSKLSYLFNFFIKIINFYFYFFYNEKVKKVISYDVDSFLNNKNLCKFIEKWSNEFPITLNKNKEFLRWRLSRPDKFYKILTIEKNQEIEAYAVICKSKMQKVPIIAIIDFINLTRNKLNTFNLMGKINEEALKTNSEAITIMMNKSRAKEYKLRNYGFFKSPYCYDFIFNNLSERLMPSIFKNEENWHITWIDFDDH